MTRHVNAALARKLAAGQRDTVERPRTLLRALRLTLAKAASERLNLPLSVIGIRQAARRQDDLTAGIAETWLLLTFVAEGGQVASACLDPVCVSAIVQMQTLGEVLPGAPAARPFTDTDAAMVAPLMEDVLSRAPEQVVDPHGSVDLDPFEYAGRAADLHELSLALCDDAYQAFDLTVELTGGAQQGQVTLLLPQKQNAQDEDAPDPADGGPDLEQASGVIRAELNAVICRLVVPLSEFSQLRAGDMVPLAGARLDRTETLTVDKARVAIGRLGQCGGMRAVRINEQMQAAVLLAAEEPEFSAASPTAPVPDDPMPVTRPAKATPPTIDIAQSLDGQIMPDEELPEGSSERIAEEISQLAGLTGAAGETDAHG